MKKGLAILVGLVVYLGFFVGWHEAGVVALLGGFLLFVWHAEPEATRRAWKAERRAGYGVSEDGSGGDGSGGDGSGG
jgi:hypothetical protein